MKKFSTKSFKEMQIVRESDDYKFLMNRMLDVGDLADQASMNSFVMRLIINFYNLKMAEMLGYLSGDDYPNFYKGVKKYNEELSRWLQLNENSPYADDVCKILDELDLVDGEEEND